MTRINRIRLAFLLTLLPLVGLASTLIRSVPNDFGVGSIAMELDSSRDQAIRQCDRYNNATTRLERTSKISINLDDGTWTRVEAKNSESPWRELRQSDWQFRVSDLPTKSKVVNDSQVNSILPTRRIQIDRKKETANEHQSRVIEIPQAAWTSYHDRFLVSLNSTSVWTLDMLDPHSSLIETVVPSHLDLCLIPRSRELFLIENPLNKAPPFDVNSQPVASKPNPAFGPPLTARLYSIRSDGTPQLKHRFQIASGPAGVATTNWIASKALDSSDGVPRFAHLSIGGDALVVRRLADGSVLDTIALPETMDWKHDSLEMGFYTGYVVLKRPSGSMTFDLFDLVWRQQPFPETHLATQDSDHTRSVWIHSKTWDRAWVVDNLTGHVLSKFEIANGDQLKFLDSNTLVQLSTRDVFTVTVLAADTGQVIREFRPFNWLRWMLPVLLLGYLVWSLGFLSSSAVGNPWWRPWCVMGIALTGLTARAIVAGPTNDPGRLIFVFAQAISTALFTQLVFGLLLGRDRWKRFLIVTGSFLALLIALLAFVFHDAPQTAWLALATTIVPACLTMVMWVVLRWRGVRVAPFREPLVSHALQSNAMERTNDFNVNRISIRDGLVWTGLFALVFGAARPILSSVDVLPQIAYAWQTIGIGLGIALLTVLTMLGHVRVLAATTMTIGVVLAVVLMADCFDRFARGFYRVEWFDRYSNAHGLMTFTAAMILVWWPLRRDGWRLRKTSLASRS